MSSCSLPILGLFLLLFEVGTDLLVRLLDLLSENFLHLDGVVFFKLIRWQLRGGCPRWACSVIIASLGSECVRVINEMGGRYAWSGLILSLRIWPVGCLLVARRHKHSWLVASSHWWRCLQEILLLFNLLSSYYNAPHAFISVALLSDSNTFQNLGRTILCWLGLWQDQVWNHLGSNLLGVKSSIGLMSSSLNLVRWAFRDLLDSEADYTAANLDSLSFVDFKLYRVVL